MTTAKELKFCHYCGNKLLEGLCPDCQPTKSIMKMRWTFECKKCSLIHQTFKEVKNYHCENCGSVIKRQGEEVPLEVLKSSLRV